MSEFNGLAKFCCAHPREYLTDSDEHGYALCTRCGGAIIVRLTAYVLDRAFEAMFKTDIQT